MNIKNLNLKKIDNKLYKMIIMCSIIIIPIIIIIILISIITGGKVSYEKLEIKMKNAAISYAKEKDKLPKNDGGIIKVTYDELVQNENIKSMKKLLSEQDQEICEGYVTIMNNNNYYLYSPYLNCKGKYTTSTIVSKIIDPTKIVESGNGLYKNGNDYIFRGEFVDNYVYFAEQIWRIIKINDDNSIKVIQEKSNVETVWDNRYNLIEKNYDGINDYLISRIRDKIASIYNDEKTFTKSDKAYIISKNLCIGRRSESETINNGSVECKNRLEKQPLGLIQVNEYINASIDPNCNFITNKSCQNYNYISKFNKHFWTITASTTDTNKVYKVSTSPFQTNASNYSYTNVVMNISGDAIYASGDGTIDNPYKIR